jgi:benzoate-CoA ligase family protein
MSETGEETFNLAEWLLDRNVTEGRGDRPALRYRDAVYSYAELLDQANRCANALLELGAAPERRVLLVLPDGPEFVAAWLGTLKAGSVFAMANTIHPAEDYAYYLAYTRAPVAVVHESVLDRILEVLPGARHLRSLLVVSDPPPSGGSGAGPVGADGTSGAAGALGRPIDQNEQPGPAGPATATLPVGHGRPEAALRPVEPPGPVGQARPVRMERWETFVPRQPDRLDPPDTGPDDIAGWLFTSGSTGRPKAAVHLHQDFRYNIERYAKIVVGYRESDITLSVPKLFFGYATGTNLMFPLAFGGQTALFSERSTPETVFEMIARYRPTVLTSVPTTINGMLQLEGASRRDLSSLRACLSAGEALPAELYRRWVETFHVEILDGIGSAEMFHIYISNRPGEVRPGSLGRTVPGYEARVVGPDGNEVPPGETGTLWIKGGSRALCYWGSREKSQQTFRGDWCVTGDQFRVDTEGFFWYEGRADDMLKVGGIFVSPLEIEDCLLTHPTVGEVCVVGAEDDGGLVKPKAYVVVKPGIDAGPALAEELKRFVKGKLSPYKYPRFVEFLESLPRNDRGKVQRTLLRQRAQRP